MSRPEIGLERPTLPCDLVPTREDAREGRRRGGFTLLEMAVVAMLVGMVIAVAYPPLTSFANRSASSSAADAFVRSNELARAAAVRYGRTAKLNLTASTASFWVTVDTSGTGVLDTIGVLQSYGGNGVSLSSSVTLICYDSRGLRSTTGSCPSGTQTMVFSRASLVDTVLITGLGKVLK